MPLWVILWLMMQLLVLGCSSGSSELESAWRCQKSLTHVKIVGFVFIQESESLYVNSLNLFWGILKGPSLWLHCVEIRFCSVLEWHILVCNAPCISFAKHCCLPLLLGWQVALFSNLAEPWKYTCLASAQCLCDKRDNAAHQKWP